MISVIVPVYKTEKFLNRCIASIVNQSYKELEIILVDDGSPDNCPQMCDDWAARDSRIRVIHKENGGLSVARNVGIALATGEYISFVDSDDYIRSDMYKILHEKSLITDVDIICCGHEDVNEEGKIIKRCLGKRLTPNFDKIYSGGEYLKYALDNSFLPVVWNKLYKRQFLGLAPFKPHALAEDARLVLDKTERDTKLSFIRERLYYYTARHGSISAGFNDKYYYDGVMHYFETERSVLARFPSLSHDLKSTQIRTLLRFLFKMPMSYLSRRPPSFLMVEHLLAKNEQLVLYCDIPSSMKAFFIAYQVSKKSAKILADRLYFED